jgi:hypothetical protein
MRNESVLPVGYFVQIPGTVQIKFTSSVAGTLHRPIPKQAPELEQGLLMARIGQRPILAICLPVDHPGSCGLH